MNVDRRNFGKILGDVISEIETCEFMSIDLEMSGLSSKGGGQNIENADDKEEVRYSKNRNGVDGIQVLQFGLCLFHYDELLETFVARPYNFWLYPAQCFFVQRRFVCQASSLTFLRECGSFDFNHWIDFGIPYLSKFEEQAINSMLKREAENPSHDSSEHNDRAEGNEKKHFEQIEAFEEACGFLRLIETIFVSKKLVVGHNMWLDLLNILNSFWKRLPATFPEFKSLMKETFSLVIDTKVLVESFGLFKYFQDTWLGASYETVTHPKNPTFQNPRISLSPGVLFERYLHENQKHEAGYDAYMTGILFLKCFQKLNGQKFEHDRLFAKEIDIFRNQVYMRFSPINFFLNPKPRSTWLGENDNAYIDPSFCKVLKNVSRYLKHEDIRQSLPVDCLIKSLGRGAICIRCPTSQIFGTIDHCLNTLDLDLKTMSLFDYLADHKAQQEERKRENTLKRQRLSSSTATPSTSNPNPSGNTNSTTINTTTYNDNDNDSDNNNMLDKTNPNKKIKTSEYISKETNCSIT